MDLDGVELDSTVGSRKKLNQSSKEKADKVENYVIGLLEGGHRDRVLALLGDAPEEIIASYEDSDSMDDFRADYGMALSHNPALRWYGKLAKMFSGSQFGVNEGELFLKAPRDSLKMALNHFNSDFNSMDENSPIVSVLRNAYDQVQKAEEERVSKQMEGDYVVNSEDTPPGMASMLNPKSILRIDDNEFMDTQSPHLRPHPEAPVVDDESSVDSVLGMDDSGDDDYRFKTSSFYGIW